MRLVKQSIIFLVIFLNSVSLSFALPTFGTHPSPDLNLPFKDFNHYSQNFADWGIQLDLHYDQPISIKNKQIQDTVRQHYFGEHSVWEQKKAEEIVQQKKAIVAYEKQILKYNADPKNFALGWDNPISQNSNTLYDAATIAKLESNMNLDQLLKDNQYDPKHRAIVVQNANTRIVPTNQGYYKDNKAPGEGADFDYLQNSVTWAGTPVYILGYSVDKAWDLVWTPDCIGWIENDKVATVDDQFINTWKNKTLIALINPDVNIIDEEKNVTRFLGYVGMILPLQKNYHSGFNVLIPVKSTTGEAQIHFAYLAAEDAVEVPYLLTPRHFVTLMQHQLGRHFTWGGGHPYGWNKESFYNDASAEMKYLFVPFGIYLPRHSTNQVNQDEVPGRADSFTKNAAGKTTTVEERIAYLQKNGHPFMTIINGLALYLGNYASNNNPTKEALAYHNIFGLSPSQESRDTGKDINRRAVIAKACILPLLASYPEDSNLSSSIMGKNNFNLMYLDDSATSTIDKKADIKSLMSL